MTPQGPDPAVAELVRQGQQLEDDGQPAAALERYREAAARAPDDARVRLNLGNALAALGRHAEAIGTYRRAVDLDPALAGAQFNLGHALLAAGDASGAIGAYRAATGLRADWAEGWVGLACALEEAGDADAAVDAYRRALALEPGHAGAANNLVSLLQQLGRSDEARAALHAALARAPDDPALLRRLGQLHRARAEVDEAIAVYRRLLALQPDDYASWSDLLFCLGFRPEASPAELLAEHRRFGERLSGAVTALAPRVTPDPDRPLRIGYVSADFRRHPVACFIAPLLREHDRGRFEVCCYYNKGEADPMTERLRACADRWRDVAGLPDDAVAAQIVEDRIDVLVDLSGHTGDNRLGVFARRPAPVQMTWVGYLGTTGLPAIDYRLCDRHTDPDGAERWQVETPLRLPDSQWCYEPLALMPAATPLPYRRNGHWTFGSFNQPLKLNDAVLAAWAGLLQAVPGSRLLAVGLPDAAVVERVRGVLGAHGVAPERVELRGRLLVKDYYESFAEVDVALDPWPYNGGTTTCDALLAGVPVLTVAGERAVARGGVSLLTTLGLAEWIAPSPAALVPHAVALLRSPDRVAALRAELPDRMRASPLMDAPRFARAMEDLYVRAWRQWCAARATVSAPPARMSPDPR